MRKHLRVVPLIVAVSSVIAAQGTMMFDAASIKVNKSGEAGGQFGIRPGQISVVNYTLRDIVRNAYGVQRYQIVGGPEWFERDRFDIRAKAP